MKVLQDCGLRVLDLYNLESGDIDFFKLPYTIDQDGEKVVYFDQWQLWLKHYMSEDDYYLIDESKIILQRPF